MRKIFDLKTYNPYKLTALKRNSLSAPVKILLDKKMLNGNILDFACGNGDDVRILHNEHKLDIVGYDKYNNNFNTIPNNTYETIMCNYCFNVIPTLDEHRSVLNSLIDLSNHNIFIAVRSDIKAVKSNWEYIEEYKGYITSKGSFQRFYTVDMCKELFGDIEVIHSNRGFILFKLGGNDGY